jgi:hypothetical protein
MAQVRKAVNKSSLWVNSDLAPFSTGIFRRRKAPSKNAFTVRARTVNAKGARFELIQDHENEPMGR